MIRVQREPFDVGAEIARLCAGDTAAGGVCVFIGRVREFAHGAALEAMTLEHYPGMTERQLQALEAEARRRWPLAATLIIHRYGRLLPGEAIVLVVTAAAHREAAFAACRFLIDCLKTTAPFWKAEETAAGRRWVDACAADDAAALGWRDGAPGDRPREQGS